MIPFKIKLAQSPIPKGAERVEKVYVNEYNGQPIVDNFKVEPLIFPGELEEINLELKEGTRYQITIVTSVTVNGASVDNVSSQFAIDTASTSFGVADDMLPSEGYFYRGQVSSMRLDNVDKIIAESSKQMDFKIERGTNTAIVDTDIGFVMVMRCTERATNLLFANWTQLSGDATKTGSYDIYYGGRRWRPHNCTEQDAIAISNAITINRDKSNNLASHAIPTSGLTYVSYANGVSNYRCSAILIGSTTVTSRDYTGTNLSATYPYYGVRVFLEITD